MKHARMALLTAALLLAGCGQTAGISYAPPMEDRLVIYTSHQPEVYGPIVKEFEERTGIWVQVETGGTAGLLERIAAQADAPPCDLIFGGGVETLDAYRDYFAPCQSQNASKTYLAYRSPEGRWVPFSSLPIVIIYNPKLVSANRPMGWKSLLEPQWKGKIALADPNVSGSSYTALATMLQALPLEQAELLRRLADNLSGQVQERSGDVVGAVAGGSCAIGVTLEETALKGLAAGQDIAMIYPQEGTSAVPDGAAVLAGCAHPENAQAFLDFILSPDVQERLGSTMSRRSVRADLFVPEGKTHGFVTLDYDLEWATSHRQEVLAQWNLLMKEAAP